ncbi:MAG: site-specific integrase [Spirochaetia bacterium]|jgi:integrase/recombinase XerD|nr:site-specific integrase [Spirochaetia bacterium]
METVQKIGLDDLCNKVKTELNRLKYKKVRIQLYEKNWKELQNFMDDQNVCHFDSEIGNSFLFQKFGATNLKDLSSKAMRQVRAINMLIEYQIHGYVLSKRRRIPQPFTESVNKLFEAYILKRVQDGRSAKTIESDRIYLTRFSDHIGSIHLESLKNLESKHIFDYVNSMAGLTNASIYCGLCNLRNILRYLYADNAIKVNLESIVPSIKIDKTAKIPSAFSEDEVNRLLKSVDRGNPKGKRDYAILLLAARLGMRAGEICNLEFSNMNWTSNEIQFNQTKTGKHILLPLLPDVGNAIIGYLKYGRPQSKDEHIFLRHVCPISSLSPPTLHSIVSLYLRKASISIPPGKKHGPHALRHSLASALLVKNVPLPVISEVLGHSNSQTTSIYLKIDLTHLKQCMLDVPEKGEWEGKHVED